MLYYMNTVQNYQVLLQMDQSRFQNGEVVFCKDEETFYLYNDGWTQVAAAADNSGLTMSLYDLNKSIMPQLEPIADFTNVIEDINIWREKTNNEYYLLYGKEVSYFTLFAKDVLSHEDLGTVTIDCLRNVGCVYAIDLNKDNVWEIWCDWDGEATCLYLFPYDNGVVEII